MKIFEKLKNKFFPKKEAKNLDYLKEDLKSIRKNPASITVLLALIVLPWFYAWFNISASWNPYWNTENIKIAVVNDDKWIEFAGKNINVWKSVIENLQENHSMWWNFVNKEEAQDWVTKWKYYASIEIWENFSEKLTSFLSDNPEKPEIIYTVNEKLNAIAPNITKKWVEWISSSIEANFISSIYEEAFKKANVTAEKIESYTGTINKARKILAEVNKKLPEVKTTLENWQNSIEKGKIVINQVDKWLTELEKVIKILQENKKDIPLEKIFDKAEESVKLQIKLVNFLLNQNSTFLAVWTDTIKSLNSEILPKINRNLEKLQRWENILKNLNRFLKPIQEITWSKIILKIIEKNNSILADISSLKNINNKISWTLIVWENISENLLTEARILENRINQKLEDLSNYIDNNLKTDFENFTKKLQEIEKAIEETNKKILEKIPEIKEEIQKVNQTISKWESNLKTILENWQKIENTIKVLNKLSAKMSDERINEILEIMLLNPENEQNFFKYPVKITTKSLFPSPNYGSSISPFFTVLALWVWALLSVSMLSVYSSNSVKDKKYRLWYVNRLLFFITIWIFQAIIIVLGNIFFFHVHITNPFVFLFSSIFIIILFQTFVFSLVYIFWNAGKVFVILILLLQLSAWWWTFPVELTNSFFVKVHPYLPFTYAIDLLREASFWIVEEILWKNIISLFVMFLIIFFTALFLSKYLTKIFIKMDKRTEWMDIFH